MHGELPLGASFGDHAFIHPGKWKLSGSIGGRYESAEAILDDGWMVDSATT
jgi:hypothetical protein